MGPLGLNFTEAGLRESSEELQEEVLLSQMRVSYANRLPCVVSCREGTGKAAGVALHRVLSTVNEESGGDLSVILHCHDARITRPMDALQLMSAFPNIYFSISGVITHTKCPRELLNTVYDVPIQRLLIGTGAPQFAPKGYEYRVCLPPDAIFIAEKVAEIKREDIEVILKQTRENAERVLKLPPVEHLIDMEELSLERIAVLSS